MVDAAPVAGVVVAVVFGTGAGDSTLFEAVESVGGGVSRAAGVVVVWGTTVGGVAGVLVRGGSGVGAGVFFSWGATGWLVWRGGAAAACMVRSKREAV